jgi:hypothetical protein
MTTPPIFTAKEADVISSAFTLANAYVASTIETECVSVGAWFDTRVMLDPREHCGEVIDMNAELIRYGENSGLLVRHPRCRYMVRFSKTEARV